MRAPAEMRIVSHVSFTDSLSSRSLSFSLHMCIPIQIVFYTQKYIDTRLCYMCGTVLDFFLLLFFFSRNAHWSFQLVALSTYT